MFSFFQKYASYHCTSNSEHRMKSPYMGLLPDCLLSLLSQSKHWRIHVPPPPNGTQFFHVRIHFHRKVSASNVGALNKVAPHGKSRICPWQNILCRFWLIWFMNQRALYNPGLWCIVGIVGVYAHLSWPQEKTEELHIWYTHAPISALKYFVILTYDF